MSDTKPTDDAKDEPIPADTAVATKEKLEAKLDAHFSDVQATDGPAAAADDEAGDAEDDAEDAKKEDAGEMGKEPDILPRGNALRTRSALLILAGAVPAFLLMA